jgi:DNA-binding MarR family transcriptional regulator
LIFLTLNFSTVTTKGFEMTTLAIKYLQFADVGEKIQASYNLSSKECKILRVITRAHLQNSSLRVQSLLSMSDIASPATIHKAIKSLVSKGLLKINHSDTDARIKLLSPTSRALKLYDELGRRMK